MKYIVWIRHMKWTVVAPNVDIAMIAIYSRMQTNESIEFYHWATQEQIDNALFPNIYDIKIFTKKKAKEYVKFMKDNEKEIIEAIHSITDLEKEIIDTTEELIIDILATDNIQDIAILRERANTMKIRFIDLQDQIQKLKARKDLKN